MKQDTARFVALVSVGFALGTGMWLTVVQAGQPVDWTILGAGLAATVLSGALWRYAERRRRWR